MEGEELRCNRIQVVDLNRFDVPSSCVRNVLKGVENHGRCSTPEGLGGNPRYYTIILSVLSDFRQYDCQCQTMPLSYV